MIILLPLIPLFFIIWFLLGGLRSAFGKAVLIFSIIIFLASLIIFAWAFNQLPQSKPISLTPCEQYNLRYGGGGC